MLIQPLRTLSFVKVLLKLDLLFLTFVDARKSLIQLCLHFHLRFNEIVKEFFNRNFAVAIMVHLLKENVCDIAVKVRSFALK